MKKENKKTKGIPLYKRPTYIVGTLAVAIALIAGVSLYCGKDGDQPFTLPVINQGVIVAKVGGDNVKLAELEKVKASIPQLKDIPMEIVFNQLLEAYINNKIILDEAKNAGLQNRPEVKKLLKDAEDQILFQAYLSERLKERMTPDKLQALYQEELKNYKPQEQVHARHILVNSEKEAKDIIVQLKAGVDFKELANKYSLDKDPNHLTGGDLGYFTKGEMIPEFANAAFDLKKGTFSQTPVKTAFGWHVILVEDKRLAPAPSYAEVEEAIKARFIELDVPQIIAEERQKANVQIFKTVEQKPVEVNTPQTETLPAVDVEEEEVVDEEISAAAADTAKAEADEKTAEKADAQ